MCLKDIIYTNVVLGVEKYPWTVAKIWQDADKNQTL